MTLLLAALPYLLAALTGAVPAAWLAAKWYAGRLDVARQDATALQAFLDETRDQRDAAQAEVQRLLQAGGETLAELRAARRTIEERAKPGEALADLREAFK